MKIFIWISILFSLGISDELIISYRAITENNILFGEEFNVSKVLKKTNQYYVIGECNFINNDDNNETNTIKIIKHHKEEMLNCFSKNVNAKIIDTIKSINNVVNSKTSFAIPPQRVITNIDNALIQIKIIKSKM